jgi:hypothetical protein
VWGHPNRGSDGNAIVQSNCRTCYFWCHSGWVIETNSLAEGCDLHVLDFPTTKTCTFYSREPGTDDA